MVRKLEVAIKAGPQTCASEPGVFCPWMRSRRFGQTFVCGLFDRKELRDQHGVPSGSGWLQRLPECLSSEVAS